MLHIINQSPYRYNALTTCLRFALPGSAILFIEDGVIAVLKNSILVKQLRIAAQNHKLYALAPDLSARGLVEDCLPEITMIDDNGFVDLVIAYHPIQTWR
jgi:tRNA 2-thiouridine synthesizing protein B